MSNRKKSLAHPSMKSLKRKRGETVAVLPVIVGFHNKAVNILI